MHEYELDERQRRRRSRSSSSEYRGKRPKREVDYKRDGDKDRRRRSHDHRRAHPRRSRSRTQDEASRQRRRQYSREGYQDRDRNSPKNDRDPYSSSRPNRRRSASPPQSPPSRRNVPSRSPPATHAKRSRNPLPSQNQVFTKKLDTSSPQDSLAVTKPEAPPPIEKQKPNFAPTGKLAAETNKVAGTDIVLKYNEPPESRKPPASCPWRLYVFKPPAPDPIEAPLELYLRSCWLFGRERSVVDFPVEHPSCSKQHAVIQFRYVEKRSEFGDREGRVKPYLIDLESANGSKINGERVEARRFVELRSGDVLGFGESTREYVVLLPPKG